MASPTILSYTFQDTNGVKASAPYYINYDGATTNADDLITEWGVLGNLLDNCSGGQIIGGRISIPLAPITGMKTAPVAGTDVSDVAVLNFRNDTTRYLFGELIPNLAAALITGGRINLSNTDLAALITHITSGFTGGNYANTAGQGLVSLNDAFQGDRKHRAQLMARSKATP